MDDKSPTSEGGALAMKCRLEAGAFTETRLLLLRKLQLSELHCKLGWLFNLRGQHYQLKYLDKYGDLITFSSEEEFQLALANYLQPEFRVLITPAEALPATKWRKAPGAAPVKSVAFSDAVVESDGTAGQPVVAETAEKQSVQMESQPAEKPSTAEEAASLRLVPKPAIARRLRAAAGGGGGGGGRFTNGGIAAEQKQQRQQQQRRSIQKHHQRPCWEAPATTYQPAPPPLPIASDDFLHHGIACSRCGSDPLIGWRFKCSRCPNYNLCSTCFDTYSHGHGFYRLP